MSIAPHRSEHPVLGRYELGPAIGRGATAVVHRARDRVSGEDVAVKAVPIELGLSERFAVEVQAAARLDHPAIVALRDSGRDSECLYLVSDLVDGPSLAAALRGEDPLSDRSVIAIGAQILAGLAHAHAHEVVHRDVKPANILLSAGGRARLTDFGVARLADRASITMTGSIVGTMAYMAPEQARGEQAGPAADVYAACLVLYEAFTGHNPLQGSSPAEAARRAAHGVSEPLGALRPDLPPAVTRAVDAGLRFAPEQRPRADTLAIELDAALAASGGAGRVAAPLGGRLARLNGRLPQLLSAIGAAAVSVVAAIELGDELGLTGPLPVVAGACGAAALAVWTPRLTVALVALAAVAGALSIGIGLGLLVATLAVVLLLTGAAQGRMVLAPLAAPALFALGLGPLHAALCGLAPRWSTRLWSALMGVLVTLAWQLVHGADNLLAGGPFAPRLTEKLAGGASPEPVVRLLADTLAPAPAIILQSAVLAAAALVVPAVVRRPAGVTRAVAAGLWVAALAVGLALCSADPAAALGATIPAAIVVLVWAVWPWRSPAGRVPANAFATLRGPA